MEARTVRPYIAAIDGASATGKSAVVQAVAARFGWTAVLEAVDRIDPPPSLEFDTPGQLLALEFQLLEEEGRRFREATRRKRRGQLVLVDTGFWGPLTYTWGLVVAGLAEAPLLSLLVDRAERLLAQGRWGLADLSIYLDAPATVRAHRARTDPVRHPSRLQRRHQLVGRIERQLFETVFPQILSGRIRWVPAADTVDRVAGRVQREIERAPAGPVEGRVARSVLAFFRTAPGFPSSAIVKKLALSRRPPDPR